MKDSRSSTKPTISPIETVRSEMERVLTENRYGGGSASKSDLLALIADWRSRLVDAAAPR